MEYVHWLNQIHRASVPVASGKGADLGDMTSAGWPVPHGFVVTVDAGSRFVDSSGLGTGSAAVDDAERLAEC